MVVTVASGKGGTGKTLVATGLADVLSGEAGSNVQLVDCDVEEPNAHLFLRPQLHRSEEVTHPVPQVDLTQCTFCGRCAQVCEFHAIAVLSGKVMVFTEMCHGCGSCARQCPEGAITEVPELLGHLEFGRAGAIAFAHGRLEVGQALATPVIRQLKARALPRAASTAMSILDAPPGNACSVVETLRGSDYAILVTEPTPFGLHDLKLAVELARDALGLPVGVIINRDGMGDAGVESFCAAAGVPVLTRLPFDRRVARAYSEGQLWTRVLPEYRSQMLEVARAVRSLTEATS
ncbi:MAG: 4Fe-4S binding protein [Anaerolineae bacterium]|nr:4Fe-4S binding protein [Anaerolineae bacterium]